jgi:hypothetical protein
VSPPYIFSHRIGHGKHLRHLLHFQRWEDGKIIEERYYRGDLMAQKISDGILDDWPPK